MSPLKSFLLNAYKAQVQSFPLIFQPHMVSLAPVTEVLEEKELP